MSPLIVQPSATNTHGGEHELSELRAYIGPSDCEMLAEALDGQLAIVWGKTSRDLTAWRRIQIGDPVLFYHDKHYFERARVAHKFRSARLARYLWADEWRNQAGLPYEHIIVYHKPRRLHLGAREFNRAVGYRPYYWLRRFIVLNEHRSVAGLALLRRVRPD